MHLWESVCVCFPWLAVFGLRFCIAVVSLPVQGKTRGRSVNRRREGVRRAREGRAGRKGSFRGRSALSRGKILKLFGE